MRKVLVALAAMLGALAIQPASAQGFPAKPIRIVVPFPAGGTTDIMARQLAARMSPRLGVSVLVENRPGASGIIGTQYVAQSAPDGYTLLIPGSPHSINSAVRKEVLGYDPIASFAPISLIGTVPLVLVVHPSLPAKTYQEFVAYARANPDRIQCGIVEAAAPHLATVMLGSMTGLKLLHVRYKGDTPMVADLVGGHINCLIAVSTPVLGDIRAGKIRPLAVTSLKRLSILPEVPTLSELGLADFQAESWYGVFAPAGTPPALVTQLAEEFVRAARDPGVVQYLSSTGAELVAGGPKELGDFLAKEVARWKALVAKAGIVITQ